MFSFLPFALTVNPLAMPLTFDAVTATEEYWATDSRPDSLISPSTLRPPAPTASPGPEKPMKPPASPLAVTVARLVRLVLVTSPPVAHPMAPPA